MNELVVVRLVQTLHIALVASLLIGWLPAWKLKSKGNLLWWIYGICIVMVLSMAILGNPQFSLGDRMRDSLVTGDHSPYAMLNKLVGGRQRGMSYRAGCYIVQLDGVRIVAIAYWVMVVYGWKRLCRKTTPEIKLKESDLGN